MADMQFDLVSPERSLASFAAASVQIPGADGDLTVMPDHAPTITTLRPGVMRVEAAGQSHEYVVTGGFAEIGTAGVSVLAEMALARGDVTQADMDGICDQAQAVYDQAKANMGDVDAAAKLLSDVAAVAGELGLTAKTANL